MTAKDLRLSWRTYFTLDMASKDWGRRAQTWSSKPASEIASAIGAPWSPNPTNPIFSSDMTAFPTSGDQLEREFPQAFCVTGIDGVGCVPPGKVRWAPRDLLRLITVLKVKTADALKKRRGSEQY
jgi:hypothetical protein